MIFLDKSKTSGLGISTYLMVLLIYSHILKSKDMESVKVQNSDLAKMILE